MPTISPKALDRLIQKYGQDAASIAREINDAERIRDRIANLDARISKAILRHKAELLELANEGQAIKKTCGHLATTYHPDASGNNDSWTRCDYCGAEIK